MRTLSEINKQRIGDSNRGKVRTEEIKLKLSQALTGRSLSEEHKQNIRLSLKGRVITEEWRRKIARANTGHYPSEEARLHMSIAQRKRWEHVRSTRLEIDETTKV